MSTLFQPTALVGAIAIAMGFSTSVSATTETQSAKSSLSTIVVTATRSEENIENVPARISIIEPKVLDQSPIASLPHLLINDASINMVQTGGFGQQASIFLRGTESDHTLVMRDGVRLNTPSQGSASIQFVDTTDLKQIEVLKGPASVLYGTDAIGGVIQLVSKTPEKTGAFVTGEIGENKTYKSIIGADFAENGVYAQIRGQRLESDGTEVLSNSNQKYAYDQKGYSAKFGVDKETFSTSLDYSQNEGNGAYNSNGNLVSQDFKNEIVNLKGKVKITSDLELNARLSQFKDDLDQLDKPDFVHNTTQEAEIYGKWQSTPSQNILIGVTHKNTEADILSKGDWSPIYDVEYNRKNNSTGYFAQHQYQTKNINTQIGVRLEDDERFGSHTVGQGAIRYHFSPSTSIYTNIGSSFRAPSMNDLYAKAWGGNPNLKPEESISYEIGIDQKLPLNIMIGASTFHTEIDNLITYECVSDCSSSTSTSENLNIDKASIRGAELYAKWNQQDYFISTSYQYAKSKDEQKNEDLQRRPRQSLTVSAGIQNSVYGLSGTLSSKSAAQDYQRETPGYMTVDFNAYWNINPNVKVFTNIENVGDVKYKTASYGNGVYYINGGRQASVGVTFKY